jgi:hypothetical protein
MKSVSSLVLSALREKYRFQTTKGALSLEQLWDVPLRSKDGFDLNNIAKSINTELKAATEENFVDMARNPAKDRSQALLELVKFVIDTKLDEEQAAKDRAARSAEKQRLLEALSKKQDAAIDGLSEKEIKRRLEALGFPADAAA